MDTAIDNDNIPQWKKDLIARLRNQNKSTSVVVASSKHQQLCSFELHQQQQSSVRHLNSSWKNESVPSGGTNSEQCDVNRTSSPCSPVKKIKMVQERNWVEPKITDMVSENFNNNGYHKDEESDSSEDLQYGPGIVKKLKNKYLSLALRESNNRPTIMHMRKATSLENLLDEDVPKESNQNKHFQSRLNGNDTGKMPSSNRYHRRQTRGEMKRARSVETISRFDNDVSPLPDMRNNRQSLHEDMLIAVQTEGSDTTTYIKKTHDKTVSETNALTTNRQRINRPKRIQPIMSEKEKPPADFVKQAKMIFEKRPEQRTKKPPLTGDVAAKVDSFNSIIVKAKVEAKVSKKPPVKHTTKPVLNEKNKNNTRPVTKPDISETKPRIPMKMLELNKVTHKMEPLSLPSPIPDVSRIDFNGEYENTNLSETPDLILTSSPLQASSPVHKKFSTENFLREEIQNTSPVLTPNGNSKKITSPLVSPNRVKPASPLLSPSFTKPLSPLPKLLSPTGFSPISHISDDPDSPGYKMVSPSSIKKISSESNSAVYNFTQKKVPQDHLPVNKNVSTAKTPPSQPLQIDVNGLTETKIPLVPLGPSSPKLLQTHRDRPRSPPKFSPPPPPKVEKKPEKSLTVTEIEKNLINTAKTLQKPSVSVKNTSVEVVNTNIVPKKLKSRDSTPNSIVFNLTDRKDVPDYIANDTSRTPSRPELPKPGEGGIILIPGATILDSFVDEDEELLRSLEGPPSPCDVTFINDNILIAGKSSISQKTKRGKFKISFIEAGPEIFEYPSETSLLLDDSPVPTQQTTVGHTVPSLGGSYLANYTPKTTEEFEPGVTRSVQQNIPPTTKPDVTEVEDISSELILEEIERPFSSGNNTDILF